MNKFVSAYLSPVLLVLICGISGIFMLSAARTDALIVDEFAHIPAGYSYVKYLDYRLNPEHPPLLKVLTALPLLSKNLAFPTSSEYWKNGVNAQWDIGRLFLNGPGNDTDEITFLARLAPILLTLLLVVLIYIWSRELLGKWWALLPTFLFALSPTVLAHGHYVTTDISAAFGVVFASYFFLKHLLHPSPKHLFLAGVGFGIAQLLKFSLFLLVPFFIMIEGLYWLLELYWNSSADRTTRVRTTFRLLWRHIRALVFIFAIGFLLVYAVYVVFTWNYPPEKQLSDTISILGKFENQPLWFPVSLEKMISNPVLRPFGHYIFGLSMVFVRAAGGNTGYFLGAVTNAGWWYYFPLVFVMKEPIPSLLLFLVSIIIGIKTAFSHLKLGKRIRHLLDFVGTHVPEVSIALFIYIYWFASMRSPLNIGVRHILPTLPLLYILIASSLRMWVNAGNIGAATADSIGFMGRFTFVFRNLRSVLLKMSFVTILLVWYASESVLAAPYFLSYFNEAAGGIGGGYRYVVDSNYDWGQDLKQFSTWVKTMRQDPKNDMQKIAFDYFGGGDSAHYLGDNIIEGWWPARGNPADIGIKWFAVSISALQSGLWPTVKGFTRKPEDSYGWLREVRESPPGLGQVPTPDYRIGTSIFVYHLK